MADVIHGVASWPGVASFLGMSFTLSHGTTPGVCLYRCAPQDFPPDEFGDLVIGDGDETVVLPDCKMQSMKIERDDRGFYWILEIVDRRWRWRDFGYINGCFNQLAPLGQQRLLPWTIRSPRELAVLCLTAMGETDYDLQLPPGIDFPGSFYPLPIINVSGVNPPANWDGLPPAQALQQLADQCGCRIVYRWSTDSVLVAPIGDGVPLPPGSIAKRLPSITPPMAPSGVGVLGAPTRYQTRLALTAVGKEWDGGFWPINLLSYAPLAPGKPQINKIDFNDPIPGVTWYIILWDAADKEIVSEVNYVSEPGDTSGIIASTFAALIAANPAFKDLTAVRNPIGFLTITGQENQPFIVQVRLVDPIGGDPPPAIENQIIQAAAAPFPSWEHCYPPLFQGVRPTPQLTVVDAQRLAQESVWRCYQLTGIDVSGKGTPNIPGYGAVLRTQQIVLQDTQVDQIVPLPQDETVVLSNANIIPPGAKNQGDVLTPLTVNFYGGFARDKPAAVYGSIAYEVVSDFVMFLGADGEARELKNTPAGSQVFVSFGVEPEWFMIRFASPVYSKIPKGGLQIPNLALQTGVLVRDPLNNQIINFTRIRELPGGDPATPPAMRHYPDVQLNVTSLYDINNTLLAATILEADPIIRADFYLDGLQNEYQYKAGQTVEYNGIRAVDLDGLTWQVTWTIDESGCSTIVTQNAEHSIWIPPYPARLRAEYLPSLARINAEGNRVNMIAPARGFMRGPPGGVFRDGQ